MTETETVKKVVPKRVREKTGAISKPEVIGIGSGETKPAEPPAGYGLKVGESSPSEVYIVGDRDLDPENDFKLQTKLAPGQSGIRVLTKDQTVTQDHLERIARGF